MADFNNMESMGGQKARNILAVNALRKAFGSLQVLLVNFAEGREVFPDGDHVVVS